jgi:NNP family nitrate/nitrite transporter-like MFS transporter
MNNAAALYFKDEFGQSTESAAAIASIFGWMNLFARGLGGYLSDVGNAKMGMKGRIWVQFVLLMAEGVMVLIFANTKSLAGSIVVMIVFSLFVQAAEGSTYGIVPYVDPPSTGSISGIVGAGGNSGAVGFGMGFRQLGYETAFIIMGFSILGTGLLSVFINIKGCSGMFWGEDDVATPKTSTLAVPEEEDKAKEDVNA